MTDLLPAFGNFGITIIAFVLALSVIVAIHEYGHYIVGRWSGIHAEVFSIGFGPVLFSRIDKRGTRWQVAAVPLGGYVKFLGDKNAASMGGEPGGRNTMMGAPLWARAATVAAGPVFNFIFAMFVFVGIAFTVGTAGDTFVLRSVAPLPAIYEQELQPGDRILAVDNIDARSIVAFSDAIDDLPEQPSLPYLIERDGVQMTISGPYPRNTLVQSVSHDGAAEAAGIKAGDVITAVNGRDIFSFDQLIENVNTATEQSLSIEIWRDGESMVFTMTPVNRDLPLPEGGFETRRIIGVTGGIYFDPETVTPGVMEAFSGAADRVVNIIGTSLSAMYHMIAGNISTCNLSSPVGIAKTSGAMAQTGAVTFISFIGVLSVAVGLLNLFPIPVLDGGHLVFFAYEAVAGRPPNEQAVRVLMTAGLVIILALTLLGLMNDIFLCH